MNNDNNILEELRSLSPTLYKLKESGSQPFMVPEDYFDGLKDQVFATIDTGMAEGIGKKAFTVPENYFEDLTGNIMDRIEQVEEKEGETSGRVIELQHVRRRERMPARRWTVMAASVALFILLGVMSARFLRPNDLPQNQVALTQEEAIEYIEDNWADFDSEDLLALVDLTDEDISLGVSSSFEEEMGNYLEENIDDIDTYLLTGEI